MNEEHWDEVIGRKFLALDTRIQDLHRRIRALEMAAPITEKDPVPDRWTRLKKGCLDCGGPYLSEDADGVFVIQTKERWDRTYTLDQLWEKHKRFVNVSDGPWGSDFLRWLRDNP